MNQILDHSTLLQFPHKTTNNNYLSAQNIGFVSDRMQSPSNSKFQREQKRSPLRRMVVATKTMMFSLYAICFAMVGRHLCMTGISLDTSMIGDLQDELISIPLQSRFPFVASTTEQDDTTTSAMNRHSFGLLDGFSDEYWNDIRRTTQKKSWYGHPTVPLLNHRDVFYWNSNNLIPNFHCPRMVKMPQDAMQGEGKYVCSPQNLVRDDKPNYPSANSLTGSSSCLIYSIGSAGIYAFEDDIVRMHLNKECEIHVFDPDIRYARKCDDQLMNIHFHPWGLVSSTETTKLNLWEPNSENLSAQFLIFPRMQELLGHQNRTIDILKIDCEGCEWSTMGDWIGVGAHQILIETHGVPSPQGTPGNEWYEEKLDASKWYDTFRDHGYVLFNKEPNDSCCLELAFLKLSDEFWETPEVPVLHNELLKIAEAAAVERQPDTAEAESIGRIV